MTVHSELGESIDTYCNIMTQTTLTKSVVIRVHPGEGNNVCMLYIDLYSIEKGFYLTGAARMCHISLQMGTQHLHSILCFRDNKDNVKICILVQRLLLE